MSDGATQADEVALLVSGVMGNAVVGAYLHGSAAFGGLRPHSDIDVLVVLRRRTTHAERKEVVAGLLEISGSRARRGPSRPVELTMVVQSDVRPWRYPPQLEFLYGEWLRDEYEAGAVPSPKPSSDLAPLLTMVLQADRPLVGPPPAAILAPVPTPDLRRAIVEGIPALLDDLAPDTRNVILTLLRIWVTVDAGRVVSKDAAAEWALSRLPEEYRPVVARARRIYLGQEEDRWHDVMPRVRALAELLVDQIDRTADQIRGRRSTGPAHRAE